ncbi:AP2-like factor [Vigna unguiculata]|uniref:AP2-like factor n=1 Tax=Vigna unguiculata TaxID=3917 RepID=A0A4D6NFJ1_VIGUN|nr:AP2-like factor [Vigna unguiculata]
MGSMNLLGFSLSPQEHPSTQDHSQTAPSRFGFNPGGISNTDVAGNCFDLTSDSTPHLLNLPSYGIYEAFHRNNDIPNTTQDWKENYNSQNLLLGTSCSDQNMNNNQHHQQQQQPKLENFLGGHSFGEHDQTYGGNSASTEYMFPTQPVAGNGGSSTSNSNSIGLSMIKTWLRNQPAPSENNNNNNESGGNSGNSVQTLSLSMSTGSQSNTSLPVLSASVENGKSSSDNKQPPPTTAALDTTTTTTPTGATESAPRKSIDTFGQRTSIYRGVTRHRWTGRYEAHLWDNSCRREGQTRKGRQGGYDKEEKAARAYDLAALKYWGTTTTTNFPINHYEKEVEEMKHMTRQEYVASLRRKSSGFSRGASIYRGVTRHHQHGRWQARIGRVAGNKDLYLGTFSTQEEAAEAYDVAAIKFRGLSAVTNFDMSRYDVKSILESTTLPIGGAAKRLKDMEQVELNVEAHRTDQEDHSTTILNSHLPHGGISNNFAGTTAAAATNHHNWHSGLSFHQPQPCTTTMHYPYGQRLWCKQEQHDNSDTSHPLSYPDIHQLQLGSNGTHNFFHTNSVLHPMMNMDSASIDNSSSSNSVVYDGYGGGGGGYVMPLGTGTVVASEGDHSNQRFGDYESVYGSNDAYHAHARNLYYLSQQQSGSVDQGSACNTWVPTGIPTLAPRSLCHGAPPFSLLHE